jgi:hypothetical protein
MSAAVNNFFFSKRGWLEKARNFLYNVWLLSFEPGSNPNICATRLGPVQTSILRSFRDRMRSLHDLLRRRPSSMFMLLGGDGLPDDTRSPIFSTTFPRAPYHTDDGGSRLLKRHLPDYKCSSQKTAIFILAGVWTSGLTQYQMCSQQDPDSGFWSRGGQISPLSPTCMHDRQWQCHCVTYSAMEGFE